MTGEWQCHEVSALIAKNTLFIGDGYRAKNEELSSKGLPFARAGNIDGGFHFEDADRFPEGNLVRVGNKVSQPGDVVFTSKGTVGRFAFVRPSTPRFVYSPQLCFWRSLDHEEINPRFLYYWMFGREFFVQFKGVAGQTDMAEYVSLTDQRRMHIALPSPAEQRRIAHILGTLDDNIELNRRMNATLEAMARAIFKSWFVDFLPVRAKAAARTQTGDPVRAKMEGRDPGLPKHIVDLFPDRFEESELGEIPEGWQIGALKDVAELNPETWSKDTAPDEIEYIDLANTKWGKIGESQKYRWKDAPSRAQRVLRPGDSIVGTVRPGNGSFALVAQEGLTGSTGFAVLRPRLAIYEEYIYLAATASDNIERLTNLADGAAYPAVQLDVVLATRVVLPDKPLIESFARVAKPMMVKIAANERESRTLAALRDTLLPKLISGELRVRDSVDLLAEDRFGIQG
jgi:type I restriction enzyme S subunit